VITPAVLAAISGRRRSGTTGGGVVGPTDPHFASVVALLHFDGTDGSTTFTDVKGHTFSANGNAQLDTAQFKFGTASLLLDGTGDFASSGDHADWELGSGDHTIEMFARFNALPANGASSTFISKFSGPGNSFAWRLTIFNNAGTYSLIWDSDDNSSTPQAISISGVWAGVATGTWYHVTACRASGVTSLFADGVMLAQGADAITYFNNAVDLRIGTGNGTNNMFNGWIDEVRITKGVARYFGSPSNFTPPSAAFPDQ
jgi:hypothetical protein